MIEEYFEIEAIASQPKNKMSGSEWAENYRVLTSVTSNLPGFFQNESMIVAKEVLNAITSDNVQEVAWCSGTQNGKTETILNAIGFFISEIPAPIMLVYPEKDDAKVMSKVRLKDMIDNSRNDILKSRITLSEKREDMYNIPFVGGILYMAWSTSVNKLAGRPARYVFLDEIDKYIELKEHGRPLDLARERRKAFPNSKIILISSPVSEEGGIWEAVHSSDYLFDFYTSCPHCLNEFVFTLAQLKENDGVVFYECPYCEKEIYDKHKNQMLLNGRWKTENYTIDEIVENGWKLKLGFKSSSFMSNFLSFTDIYKEYQRALKNPETLKVFQNGWLGLPSNDDNVAGIEYNIDILIGRCEDYKILPNEVLVLTCGVDVQKNRLEYMVIGWGLNRESWVVDKGIIMGDTFQNQVWQDLDLVLNKKYKHSAGIELGVMICTVDSGYNTSIVYNYTKAREKFRVYSIKGAARSDAPEISTPRRSGLIKAVRFDVGVHSIKNIIYYWINQKEEESGYMHFSSKYCNKDFFEQLTAERLVTKKEHGRRIVKWEKIRERNEVFDLYVYNYAALSILNPPMEKYASDVQKLLNKNNMIKNKR